MVPPQAPPVERPDGAAVTFLAEIGALEKRSRALSEQFGALRSERENLAAAVSDIQNASVANRDAVSRYRASYLAGAASSAMASIATQMRSQQLTPLMDELGLRWKDLWPDRHGLNLDADGSLSLTRGTRSIGYRHFSGAEKILSLVALRLLVVQMVSRLRMVWLDEPLEHLDPRNRRVLASMLSAAGREHALDQIVVTTYEEPVVRGLSQRDGRGASSNLVYVRSADS